MFLKFELFLSVVVEVELNNFVKKQTVLCITNFASELIVERSFGDRKTIYTLPERKDRLSGHRTKTGTPSLDVILGTRH